ncbi:MAG: cytidylate kinase-like family protein [Desulfobacteraceae bacterium]|nr:cytidylate kinase-like family protein [Desulfobacteraceae bacterium]
MAEKLCARLGYECVSREIILKASAHFNTPEIKLARAIHDAPSILDRFTFGKERYTAYVQEALLNHLRKDNVVYHGLAGHFFVQGISHAIKVRIIADFEDRVAEEMQREGISSEQASKALSRDDEERRRWSAHLYGIDTRDASLYDLVIHIKPLTTDDAVELIYQAARRPCFQVTAQSMEAVKTLFLAAQVRAALVQEIPNARVTVEKGEIVVSTSGYWAEGKKLTARIDQVIDTEKEGVKVKVRLINKPLKHGV